MLKSVEGLYRNGKIELAEVPADVRNETPVIITFLESKNIDLKAHSINIDLKAHSINETQAADLRARLSTFAED